MQKVSEPLFVKRRRKLNREGERNCGMILFNGGVIMSAKRARFLIMLFAALCLLSLAIACGSDEEDDIAEDDEASPTEAAAGVKYTPSGNEGSLAGTIAFEGAVPAPKPISMDADAATASRTSLSWRGLVG
jgi:hypothetical protein